MSRDPRLLTSALLVSAWGGAALLTVTVVTPGAFAVLPTRTMAGTMVGWVLPALFLSGIAVAVIVVVLSGRRHESRPAALTAALAGAACAVSQFGINPRIARCGPKSAVRWMPCQPTTHVVWPLGYFMGIALEGSPWLCLPSPSRWDFSSSRCFVVATYRRPFR